MHATHVTPGETERLVRAAGAECALLKADVSDPKAVAAMVAEAERTLGPIDLLVTSAGIAPTEVRGEIPYLGNQPKGCPFHTRCRYAQDRCRTEAPALRPINGPTRLAACHFAGEVSLL